MYVQKNAVLLAFFTAGVTCVLVCEYVSCLCVLETCVTWHAVVWMCGAKTITWKACAVMQIMQLKQTDETVKQCLQTDRQTWAQLCMFCKCEYSIYSTVTYMREYLSVCICERGLRNGDGQRDSYELSWAGHMYTSQSVKDAPSSYCKILPDVAYIHQTRNLQSHTLDCSLLTVHRTENHTRSCRKASSPTPPHLVLTLYVLKFVCVQHIRKSCHVFSV